MADDAAGSEAAPPLTRSEEILEALGEGFCVYDRDWRLTYANRAAEAQFGMQRQAVLGRTYWDLVPHAIGTPVESLLRKAMAGRDPVEIELPSILRPGTIVSLRAFPMEEGLGLAFRDVTERHRQAQRERDQAARLEEALAKVRESEERFRAMADSAPAPVWVTSAAGPIDFVNQAFADYVGRPRDELLGDVWMELLHPEDVAAIRIARAAARDATRPYTYEARFKRHDGVWRQMLVASQPRFNDAVQRFDGYVGIATDITDARAAETRQRLLINELNHRVKNTLATVQSLARQTLKDGLTPREARTLLEARLMALSAAHNVLTRETWAGAELSDIVAEAVRPFEDAQTPRIGLSGPRVRITPYVALALSLALHELATNATKYGALSRPDGRVAASWEDGGPTITLTWRETGGPELAGPPTGKGFGSRLLSQGLAGELGAPAFLDWRREGLVCTVVAPLSV